MTKKSKIDHYTDKEALDFHIGNKSGKIEVNSSKPLISKRDLSLAYSPGVAAPVKEISKDSSASVEGLRFLSFVLQECILENKSFSPSPSQFPPYH